MVDIEKAKVMLWSAAGLLAASVAATGALVWNVSQFVAGERDAQAVRMALLRDEMAEIGDSVAVQAVEMKALRERLFDKMDQMSREQSSFRDELRRQETNTASELREVRADIRALNGAKHDGGGK